jgi:hypothetical protein
MCIAVPYQAAKVGWRVYRDTTTVRLLARGSSTGKKYIGVEEMELKRENGRRWTGKKPLGAG